MQGTSLVFSLFCVQMFLDTQSFLFKKMLSNLNEAKIFEYIDKTPVTTIMNMNLSDVGKFNQAIFAKLAQVCSDICSLFWIYLLLVRK